MNSFFSDFNHIHFIGIGGISMSALAKYSLLNFKKVSGSDREASFLTQELEKMGAKITIGTSDIMALMPDLIVYTSAIANDNFELITARELNIKILKRAEFLAKIIDEFKNSICVCGCHGKTTTSAMLTHIFMTAGWLPTTFIGGVDNHFGNFFFGDKILVIAEACEYKKNFLYLHPKTIVCTNIDTDHPDSFNGLEDTVCSTRQFVEKSHYMANADDVNSSSLLESSAITFGIEKGKVRAENIVEDDNGVCFNIVYKKKSLGAVSLKVKGLYNVYNALASISVALYYKIDFATISLALGGFDGVKRRMEHICIYKNLDVFIDYAHHPRELEQSICAYADSKTIIVFQPHTYSRTKLFMNEFIDSLRNSKKVIIYKTYPARENFDSEGDALTLYKKLKKIKKNVYYAQNREKVIKTINKDIESYNKIIFFGAGDICKIADNLKYV